VPFFTLQFQAPTGPRCDLYLAVSVPRENALKAAGLPIPAPILVKGLVDTGASVSGVDPETIEKLGLVATGVTSVLTPSTQEGVPHQARSYDVRLLIPASPASWIIPALAVIESNLKAQGFEVITWPRRIG
jgi:hypothetical protein